MLGFEIGLWDYLTFLTLFILAVAALFLTAFIGGLPGRIAIARKHPQNVVSPMAKVIVGFVRYPNRQSARPMDNYSSSLGTFH